MIKESDIFMFGKYKNKKVKYVLDIEPNYIQWCVDNIKNLKFSKSVLRKMYINISKE